LARRLDCHGDAGTRGRGRGRWCWGWDEGRLRGVFAGLAVLVRADDGLWEDVAGGLAVAGAVAGVAVLEYQADRVAVLVVQADVDLPALRVERVDVRDRDAVHRHPLRRRAVSLTAVVPLVAGQEPERRADVRRREERRHRDGRDDVERYDVPQPTPV